MEHVHTTQAFSDAYDEVEEVINQHTDFITIYCSDDEDEASKQIRQLRQMLVAYIIDRLQARI